VPEDGFTRRRGDRGGEAWGGFARRERLGVTPLKKRLEEEAWGHTFDLQKLKL
jgi:hypothetical protein